MFDLANIIWLFDNLNRDNFLLSFLFVYMLTILIDSNHSWLPVLAWECNLISMRSLDTLFVVKWHSLWHLMTRLALTSRGDARLTKSLSRLGLVYNFCLNSYYVDAFWSILICGSSWWHPSFVELGDIMKRKNSLCLKNIERDCCQSWEGYGLTLVIKLDYFHVNHDWFCRGNPLFTFIRG